jgi:non-ribosomal peptide synthetase component F
MTLDGGHLFDWRTLLDRRKGVHERLFPRLLIHLDRCDPLAGRPIRLGHEDSVVGDVTERGSLARLEELHGVRGRNLAEQRNKLARIQRLLGEGVR